VIELLILPIPNAIHVLVQGISFPETKSIFLSEDWDFESSWRTTHIKSDSIEDSDLVVTHSIDPKMMDLIESIGKKDCIILQDDESVELSEDFLSDFEEFESSIGIVYVRYGGKSKVIDRLRKGVMLDDPELLDPEYNNNRWRQEGNRVILETKYEDIYFDMPEHFSLLHTSKDLLRAVEHVLLWQWDKEINQGWIPSRRPGNRPGLSFSGGVDSTAAMCLMPDNTLLCYLKRDFSSMIDHTNALIFIEHLASQGREISVIPTNHEILRTHHGLNPGFSTDYACMAQMILAADYYDLDAAGTGMPLENAYLFHGSKFREFSESWFWKKYGPMFRYLGIPLYQPVAGCSEILSNQIVSEAGYSELSFSCLRSSIPGVTCQKCWKCFRKNIFNSKPWSPSREISKFLKKKPLKQGISTLRALQIAYAKGELPPEAKEYIPLMEEDLEFLDYHHAPALDLLPSKYRDFSTKKLDSITSRMDDSISKVNDSTFNLIRGD